MINVEKKKFPSTLFLLALVNCFVLAAYSVSAFAADSDSIASPSLNGRLHVEGVSLMDENGEEVQLRGVSTHGVAWYPQYVNEKLFRELHSEWNINVIRLAMYTEDSGGYCTDGDQEQLMMLIRQGVQFATAADLYVIVDWHILSDGDPNENLESAVEFFDQVSGSFAGQNNVFYEICNEPNGDVTWAEVKSYAEQIIPVIRNNDPDNVILVGTPDWSQGVLDAAADPITDAENVMYTLHFYAASHGDDLRQDMEEAVAAGLPVFVSEYGICDASGNGELDTDSADQWIEAMNGLNISYVCWGLSNKDESASLLVSSCDKTSDLTDEDLSPAGIWLTGMLKNAGLSDSTKPLGTVENSNSEEEETTEPVSVTEEEATEPVPSAKEETEELISAAEEPVLSAGELELQLKIVNSWETNGRSYYQYDGTIYNHGTSETGEWTVSALFNEAFTLEDSWNGEYTVSENTLFISNADYNGVIAPDGKVTDIGFIVSGSGSLNVS